MKIALLYSSSIEYMRYAFVSAYTFIKNNKTVNTEIYIYTDCCDDRVIQEYQDIANKIGPIRIVKPNKKSKLSSILDNFQTNGRWHKVVYSKYDLNCNSINADYYIFSDVDQIYIKPVESLLDGKSCIGEVYPKRLRGDVESVFKSTLTDEEFTRFNSFVPICTPGLIFTDKVFTDDLYQIFCDLLMRFIKKGIYNDELCFNAALMLAGTDIYSISNYNIPCTNDNTKEAYAVSSVGKRKFWNSLEVSTLFPDWYNNSIELDNLTSSSTFTSIAIKPSDTSLFLRKEIMNSIWLKYLFNKAHLFSESLFFIPKSPETYKCRHREISKDIFQMFITITPTSAEKIRRFYLSGYIKKDHWLSKLLEILFKLNTNNGFYEFSFDDANIEKLYSILEFISRASSNITNIEVINDR